MKSIQRDRNLPMAQMAFVLLLMHLIIAFLVH